MTTDAVTSRYHDKIPGRNVLCNHIPHFVTYMMPFIDMFYSLEYFIFLEEGFFDQDSRNKAPAQRSTLRMPNSRYCSQSGGIVVMF